MTQIQYLQRWILFFVFYTCENLLLCFGHISTNERPDASFQVPLLDFMTFLMVINILAWVSLRRLGLCSRTYEITHQLSVIFQTNFLSVYSYFFLPGCIFTFLNFLSSTINFLLVKKSIVNKIKYKSLRGTRKFLSEVFLEALSI